MWVMGEPEAKLVGGGGDGGGWGGGPLIGITADVEDLPRPSVVASRYKCATTYAEAVVAAGGVPVLLCPRVELVGAYVARLDGLIMTGGLDIDPGLLTEGPSAGVALHPAATVMDARRQRFELALLAAVDARPELAVLGVCLGMQLMGVHAGARLVQHLDDELATAEDHRDDREHGLVVGPAWGKSVLAGLNGLALVASNHHQAVDGHETQGRLRELARSADGVVEAVDDPARRFYVGVQWHPERTRQPELGWRVIERLVVAARLG